MSQSISQLLRSAAARFSASGSPVLDAQVLLALVLDCQRSHLVAWPDKVLPAADIKAFEALVCRRAAGEPVAYLTGRREFWSLELSVTHDTLVPRADTEVLVARALELLPAEARCTVADLGTGSGAIALAIASERPQAQIIATDLSAPALAVARQNADRHGLHNIRFVQGDWLAPLAGLQFDLIASNPPYVNSTDPCLTMGDTAFEPRGALSAGADGLDAIRVLAISLRAFLNDNGSVLLEHGATQAAAVAQLLRQGGMHEIATHEDLSGLPRCTEARRSPG